MKYKLYRDLQSWAVPTDWWKDILINFVTGLPILTNWKENSYDFILVIIDQLTKMVYYKPIKITINAQGLAEVIIDIVVYHHGLSNSIVTNRGSLFTSKFWSSFCYFFSINRQLSSAFHLQTNSETEWQNSIIKAHLQAFVNFK